MKNDTVNIFAGICEIMGSFDGAFGEGLLEYPQYLAVDVLGNIFVN